MTIEPREDDQAVAAAFASLNAASAEHFPPPPVDELIMRGPASLRRRRLVSLAAVVGACTAVTAGGFAVAQTLGPLTGGSDSDNNGPAIQSTSTEDGTANLPHGGPNDPQSEGGVETTAVPAPPGEDLEVLVIDGPFEGDWAETCVSGPQTADFEAWAITADTGWSITAVAEGDVDGDDVVEQILALTCGEQTGVAAFTTEEDEDEDPVLASFGWVWQPDGTHEVTAITAVEDGTVALEGLDEADAAWTDRYLWDGEAFVVVDDTATAEPTESESSSSPAPDETPTTDSTSAATSSGS